MTKFFKHFKNEDFWIGVVYSALVVFVVYFFSVTSIDNTPTVYTEAPSMPRYTFVPSSSVQTMDHDEYVVQKILMDLNSYSEPDPIPYVVGVMRVPARRDNITIAKAAEALEAIETARLIAIFDEKEIKCLATAMYHESRGETFEGKAAVAWAVINRRDQSSWPDTVCRVVYQKGRNSEGVMIGQFAWSVDNPPIKEREAYDVVHSIAADLYHNYTTMEDPTGGSQYFLSEGIYPRWVRGFEETLDIGGHKFYRDNRIVTISTKG